MLKRTSWLELGAVVVFLGSALPFACSDRTTGVAGDQGGAGGQGPTGSGGAGGSYISSDGNGSQPACPVTQPTRCPDASGVGFVCGLPFDSTLKAQTANAIYLQLGRALVKVDKADGSVTPIDTKGEIRDFLIAEPFLYWLAQQGGIWRRALDGTDDPSLIAACAPGDGGLAIDSNSIYFNVGREGVYRASRTAGQESTINRVFSAPGSWIAVEAPRIYVATEGSVIYGSLGTIFAGTVTDECACTCAGGIDAGSVEEAGAPVVAAAGAAGNTGRGGSTGGGGGPIVPDLTACSSPSGETGLGGAGGHPAYYAACQKSAPILVQESLGRPSLDAQYIYFLHRGPGVLEFDLRRIVKTGGEEATLFAAASVAREHLELASFAIDGDYVYAHFLQRDADLAAISSGRIMRMNKDGSDPRVAELPPGRANSRLWDRAAASILVDDSYVYFQTTSANCSSEIDRVPKLPMSSPGDAGSPSDVVGDAATDAPSEGPAD